MRLLWALVHELQSMSKRTNTRIGVTGPQRLVIRILGRRPGLSAGELAELLRLHPSTLTGVLRRLEARKLVARAPSRLDGRRAVLHLTAAGKRLDRASQPTVEAAVGTALGSLDARTITAASRTLTALIEALHAH